MKYAILDDEPIAHRIIEGFANKMSSLEKVGNAYNAFEALQIMQKEKIDLLFLDMNMPEIQGFEFLRTLTSPPQIIVTSAHKEYALEGYEFSIVDYLLKPFSFERFLAAMNKVVTVNPAQPLRNLQQQRHYIFVKSGSKQVKVFFDDILFIEAAGNYCKLVLAKENVLTLQKISSFEKVLPPDFLRIHNSFIISKGKIKSVEGHRVQIANHTIPIGGTYKSKMRELFE